MSLLQIPIARLDGTDATLGEITGGRPALVVNVASKCGLTPQYTALEALHEEYAGRGFTVVGVPCNQFGGQEPGSSEEIAEFCSATYGAGRHPVYDALVQVADQDGRTGDVRWNFEKFLLDGDGAVVARFDPTVVPDDPRVTAAVQSLLV